MRRYLPSILISVAGLLLLILFFKPLWKIILLAPQYPEGVEMHIYVNKIGGKDPGTLQNVNILNHYIGMKPIEPDSIPELKYFPKIVWAFIILAIVFAIVNHKYGYLFWVGTLGIALCLALYDFYLWEYDYGHSLDPNAPMKFEGESFQPPLIGRKNVINFVAISLPHWGGYAIILSLILGAFATYLKFRKDD